MVFFHNGAPISWQSKRQSVVAGSTVEAEFISCSHAAREAAWLRRLHTDILQLGPTNTYRPPVIIGCDNQGAVARIADGKFSKMTKHIDVKYQQAVDEQKKNNIRVQYVNTKENAADVLTKALALEPHKGMLTPMGMEKHE